MKLKEINEMLKKSGYPVAYRFFKEKQKFPYICFFCPDGEYVYADDINYREIKNIVIELYTGTKDEEAESKLESILTENDISFEKNEVYIEKEQMYMIAYYMEVI